MNKINIELLENEEWKDVKGYEGLYGVSNMGRVYSWKSNKLMSPRNKRAGYSYVMLYKDKNSKECGIHGLVLKAFTNESEWKDIPNHRDFNKKNNILDNLEWMTESENIKHSVVNGNHKNKRLFTKKYVSMLREEYINGLSQEKISNKYNINMNTIQAILSNKHYYDENYSPPNRKFKNGYSDEFLINLKNMYYLYNLGVKQISNLLQLNYKYTYSAILNYHNQLD